MMPNWDLYKRLLGNGFSRSRKDVVIDGTVNAFLSGAADSPAYQEYAVVDGEETPMMASRKSSIECEIKAVPNSEIHIGDMVECFNEHWIVVERYCDEVGFVRGVMWLCGDKIRFQNNSTAVHTRHCVIDDGTYSKKSSDPYAFVMANTYKVYLPIDEETKKIFVDKRISFGEIYSPSGDKILEVYKVIGVDLKSKNFGEGSHIMVLTMQRDVYNPDADSLADDLCDVFARGNESATPAISGSCVIDGRDTARIGTTRRYSAVFTLADGTVVDDIAAEWQVDTVAAIKCHTNGSVCSITVPLDDDLVGETIDISVKDAEGKYGAYNKRVQVVTVG